MVELANKGGWVVWALFGLSTLVWTLLVIRVGALWPYRGKRVGQKLQVPSTSTRTLAVRQFEVEVLKTRQRVWRHHELTLSAIRAAPLLGLIGTVGGMIHAFSANADEVGSSLAAGVSEALITTQLGLVVAIPALMVFRWTEAQSQSVSSILDGLQAQIETRFRPEHGTAR